ncbi:hypothetical protein Ctob_016753, partial [Chrysochromulina tobinii]
MQLLNTVWTSAAPIAASSMLKINGSTTLTTSASVGRIEAGTLLVETGAILTTLSISVGVLEVLAGTMRVQGTAAVRAGGGTVRIDVSGTLSVAASASIRVNGAQGADSGMNHCCYHCSCWDDAYNGGGGAAAGSIWITAENMLGNGSLQATGGAGGAAGARSGFWQNAGGGGAGGRIAVHCASQLAIGIAMSAVGGQRGSNDAGNEGV